MSEAGKVFLVGAGPGDPGLLTLRAERALRTAQVLLYDALASDPVVALAPPECEAIFVGKRGGKPSMPQPDIEALMLRKAAEGKRVIRLKGGDPFVFGRGGEEAQTLRAAGIPFEIIPGITSAIAAPAYAGIPLTHRDHNVAFTVATGHEDPTKQLSALDWEKLADPNQTLVLLMAMSNLRDIVAKLQQHGLPGERPAAIIRDGTRPTQQTVVATLETIAAAAETAGIGAPSIVIIGTVVSLRSEIAWFDSAPLFGIRVLVTRPAEPDDGFVAGLWSAGALPVLAPVIAIGPPGDMTPADSALDRLPQFDWIVFSSRHAVETFFARLAARRADARAVGAVRVAAIGPKTADALKTRGVVADLLPERFVGEDVARALIDASSTGSRILIYRAAEARDELPDMLAQAGRIVEVVAAYKTSIVRDAGFAAKVERCDVLTFTSASTVGGFVENLGGEAAAHAAADGKLVACIGPVTAQAAREAGLNVAVVASTYTAQGLLEALEEHAAFRAR